eukprot:TRINITY_DN7168_c0_g1_i10.p1 TRINITY_DN7168_c0_g1~~TRINITY_DN7168_c0_g1_i10.p1  ORF type:complete len:127 (-),score=39.45 TRINITY_DN7168_c0_g1_i10:75-455(-)
MRRQLASIVCSLQELHNEKAACHHSLLPSGSQAQLPAAIEGKLHGLLELLNEKAASHYCLLPSGSQAQLPAAIAGKLHGLRKLHNEKAACHIEGKLHSLILSAAFRVSGTASSSNRRQASWPNKAA